MSTEVLYKAATVAAITADITRIRLSPMAEPGLSWQSGQYVQLWCPQAKHWLDCSIVNPPLSSGDIEIVLRHSPDLGLVNELIEIAEKKESIRVKGPLGHCVAPKHPVDEIIFIAGGTGISPVLSLLLSTLPTQKIRLFWGARKIIDFYCLSALEAFCDALPHFEYTLVLSEQDDDWTGATGLVHEVAETTLGSLEKTYVYASGPYEMVQKTWAACHQKGLPAEQFLSDMMPTPTIPSST
jgi:NAD(P)H-flavin reductase